MSMEIQANKKALKRTPDLIAMREMPFPLSACLTAAVYWLPDGSA
jgi:hypothetical protein